MPCPYIDRNDRRCQETLKVENLDKAMSLCCGHFGECPIFQRIYARQGFSLKRYLLRTFNLL